MRIVKIGGASITDKSEFEHVKLDNIEFIANLFKNNSKNLILIHGAGSFGHHQAKKFKLNEGYKNHDDYEQCRWGVCDTRRSLNRLQQYLLDAFLKANIPVIIVSPFDFLLSNNFEITKENIQRLGQHLERLVSYGYIPLLHGDVLIDEIVHWRIYSGDDLLLNLAEYFQARQCIFLTSVPGILRADGSVIEEYYVDETKFDKIDQTTLNIDVTGSMQNKVMIASEILKKIHDCQVFIVQGVSENSKTILLSTIEMVNDENFHLTGCTRVLKKKF